jgi:predicted ATPase
MQPTRKDSTQKEAYLLDRKLHSVKLDFKNVKLHGRDKEIKTLREVYNRALLRINPNSKEPKEVVFVYGYSGVGKSALVETLRDVGAIMVAGKFDQKIRSEPFSAIVEALSELCDYILAYDSNKLSDLRVKLKEKFSKKEGELKAVCNLVPKISEVVGLGEEETRKRDQGKSEGTRSGAFTKMKEGCLLFLQVVCMSSLGAMITLFIDDLQWGDVASIDLIKDIATDDDNNSLLFVGAYRDNEVDDVHPLAVQLRQLEAMGSITNVQLYIGELDLVSVNKIIADAMHSTSMEPLKELANIVYKKTEGNAFFLIQFLRGLQKDGLVYYSMEKFSWKWDAATIEAETAVSENIVDFMAGKIRQLVRSSSRHFLILFRDSFTHNY